ncbi:hypothetical protein P7K49_021940 [Saguinus oedipus]|uniref:Uncharacterized protein n=1 Tax=Saguinus oedipus TaxID=9490 RepID=A0ABQ9UU40_SAGOE|nr:hypothetical protein P7K49_021940 [Saguinus oedipus]
MVREAVRGASPVWQQPYGRLLEPERRTTSARPSLGEESVRSAGGESLHPCRGGGVVKVGGGGHGLAGGPRSWWVGGGGGHGLASGPRSRRVRAFYRGGNRRAWRGADSAGGVFRGGRAYGDWFSRSLGGRWL